MTARKWCPSQLLDESVPISVADPSDALTKDSTDYYRVADVEGTLHFGPLVPGDRMDWSYTESRGTLTVTKAEDGSFTTNREITGDGLLWWVPGDSDSISDTLETLVVNSLEPGESDVEAYFWSDEIPHVFEIVDGKGRFVRSGAAA